jgi:hypothetical protein
MLTLSYDAASKTGVMYFNGDAVSTKSGLTLADTTENAFKINSGLLVVYGGVPGQLKGWVDDFCVFDGALTANDVEYLYAGYVCTPFRNMTSMATVSWIWQTCWTCWITGWIVLWPPPRPVRKMPAVKCSIWNMLRWVSATPGSIEVFETTG